MTVIIYIYSIPIYREVRGCMRTEWLKIWQNQITGVPFFCIIFFVEEPSLYLQQGGRKLALTIYLYIYIPIYRDVRGCVSAKRLRISNNKKTRTKRWLWG